MSPHEKMSVESGSPGAPTDPATNAPGFLRIALDALPNAGGAMSGPELARECRRGFPLPAEARIERRGDHLEIRFDPESDLGIVAATQFHDLAFEHLAEGRPAEALPLLQRIVAFSPCFAPARLALVGALEDLGRESEALDELIEGLRHDPENGEYYVQAALLFIASDEMRPMSGDYAAKAIELGVDHPLAHFVLGDLALEEGRMDVAMDHFSRMRARSVARPLAAYGMAWAYSSCDRYRDCLRELETFFAGTSVLDPSSSFETAARHLYLHACVQIDHETRAIRMRHARSVLEDIRNRLGWSVELHELEIEFENDDPETGGGIRWQSLDRPGTVIVEGTTEDLANPEWLLVQAHEIMMETGPCRNTGIRHLRRMAQRFAARVCRIPEFPSEEDFVLAEWEELKQGIEATCADQLLCPLQWLAICRIVADCPDARFTFGQRRFEFHSLLADELKDGDFDSGLIPEAAGAIPALLGADALFLRHLTGMAVDSTFQYRHLSSWPRSLAIFDHWRHRTEKHFRPRDAPDLVREIALLAGFPGGDPFPVQGLLF